MDHQVEQAGRGETPRPLESSRQIPGLNQFLIQEGGGNGTGITSVFTGDKDSPQFLFTDHPERFPDKPKVVLRVNLPLRAIEDAIARGDVGPPALIERIYSHLDDETRTAIANRAREHNTHEVIKFLRKGGDPKLLPKTYFLPDIELLKAAARKTPEGSPSKKEFDPDETTQYSEAEIESTRRDLRSQRSITDQPITDPDSRRRPIHKQTWEEKISGIALNARLIPTMILQFGAMHPQRVNGQWRWVLRPNADVVRDSRQVDGQNENYYINMFQKLKAQGVKLIDMDSIGGEAPSVRPTGLRGIQLLDHTRILSAMAVKMPIVVEFSKAETFS